MRKRGAVELPWRDIVGRYFGREATDADVADAFCDYPSDHLAVASKLVGLSRSTTKWSTAMAEDRMMTPADVVAKAMSGEHGDLLRDAVGMVARELMEAERRAR